MKHEFSERLRQGMRRCTYWPSWLRPVKAVIVVGGLLILRTRCFKGYAPELRTSEGIRLTGSPTGHALNAVVFYRDEFEPVLTRVLLSTVKAGDVCIDAGANAGYFTLLLAQQVGAQGHVWAIEASERNVRRLLLNVAANGLEDRVSVIDAAYSSCNVEEMRFFVNRRNDMHSRLSLPGPLDLDYWVMGGPSAWRETVVKTTTLLKAIGRQNLARVRLIKIDIEGAEPDMLGELLQYCTHPKLMIAVEVKPAQMRAALKPLRDAGFQFLDLNNDYGWLLDRHVRPPKAVTYEDLCRRPRMVDVLALRT